jgi:hypothetical protein
MTKINPIAAAIVFAALLFAWMFRIEIIPLADRFYLVNDRFSGSTKVCVNRNPAQVFCMSPGTVWEPAHITINGN